MKPILRLGLLPLLLHALTSHAAVTVTNLALGCEAQHSLFLKSDGSLWGMGEDSFGNLGDGKFNTTNRPQQIVAGGVMDVAAGRHHSIFLKADGSLWAMGNNDYGELGDGTFNSTNRPEQVVASGVTAIAAGYYHNLFLKTDGSLWVMGYNFAGGLGDGSSIPYTNRPEQIVSSGVTAIAAGAYHSLFLKSDGSLWAMGWNFYGQLGDGTYNNTNRPEQIIASGVTAIAGGDAHTLFLKTGGALWAMGFDSFGQLGDGTFGNPAANMSTNRPQQILPSGVTAIAAGGEHSLFIKSDGSLWAMGDNEYGQLGDGTVHVSNTPKQIIANGVTAITAGLYHSLFLKSDGSLWGMGYNTSGQLGDGFTDINSPYGNLTPEQIIPWPQSALSIAPSFKTNLQLTANTGFGGTFHLLGSADLGLALNQWLPLSTNLVTVRGTNNFSLTLTNVVNTVGQRFYILQGQ